MALVYFPFEVRNGGSLVTGISTFTIVAFKKLDSGFPAIESPPSPAEVGGGVYAILYDAETRGEAVVVLDAGAGISAPAERYITLTLSSDSSRIKSNLPVAKDGYKLAADGLELVEVDDVDIIELMSRFASVLVGKSDGSGTNQVTFYKMGTNTPKVVAAIGSPGNRTGITFP